MLQYDGEPASQSKLAAPKTDKKDLTGINKEDIDARPVHLQVLAPHLFIPRKIAA
jgi:hypothetical protein